MKKILTRSLSGAVYIIIIVASIYAGRWTGNTTVGEIIFGCLFLLLGAIGTHEVLKNLAIKGIRPDKSVTYIIALLSYLFFFLWEQPSICDQPWSFGLLTAVPALMLLVFLLQLWRNDEEPFANIGYTLLPSIWVMIPMSLANHIHDLSEDLMMMIFILVWVNDTFAYLTGMLLGKHKMWVRHSPNKTWEGTIGGALFCIAAALVVGNFVPGLHLHPLDLIIIGLICSVIGTLGDLVESMFKRFCGVKDSGNIMPGHGGVLDRFDSILLAIPFIQAYLIIIEI